MAQARSSGKCRWHPSAYTGGANSPEKERPRPYGCTLQVSVSLLIEIFAAITFSIVGKGPVDTE